MIAQRALRLTPRHKQADRHGTGSLGIREKVLIVFVRESKTIAHFVILALGMVGNNR